MRKSSENHRETRGFRSLQSGIFQWEDHPWGFFFQHMTLGESLANLMDIKKKQRVPTGFNVGIAMS